jgi:hypothetical protein
MNRRRRLDWPTLRAAGSMIEKRGEPSGRTVTNLENAKDPQPAGIGPRAGRV